MGGDGGATCVADDRRRRATTTSLSWKEFLTAMDGMGGGHSSSMMMVDSWLCFYVQYVENAEF